MQWRKALTSRDQGPCRGRATPGDDGEVPRRTSDFRGLADASRVRVLGAVQASPGCGIRALADRVGLHVNTVREHLQTLEREGFVYREVLPTGTRGRPPEGFWPVTDPRQNPAAQRRVDQAREQGRANRRAVLGRGRPRQAPERDRPEQEQLDLLYDHLVDSGLQPTIDGRRQRAWMVPCPFHRIVADDQHLACQVHAQVMRDLLAQVPGPLRLESLQPYVTERSCLAQLSRVEDSPEPSTVNKPGRNRTTSEPAS